MGYYTTIARFAKTAKRTTGGASGHGIGLRREAEPAAESRYVCPACGDGSEIRDTCPRCDVAMYPRTGAVYFGEVRTRTDRAAPSMARVSSGVGVGLVLPAVAMVLFGRFLAMGNSVHLFDNMGRFNWQTLPPLVFLGLAALIWLTVFGVRRGGCALAALRRASRRRTARRPPARTAPRPRTRRWTSATASTSGYAESLAPSGRHTGARAIAPTSD